MSDPILADLFAEDRAHEAFLEALIRRIAAEARRPLSLSIRNARGGHPRALAEFDLYQRYVQIGLRHRPDLLVIAIDANCDSYTAARKRIERACVADFGGICVPACPDPHIECWYLADLQAFYRVVGIRPDVPRDKCDRDYYKSLLAKAVTEAGHPPTLKGVEFAAELVAEMDIHRAGRAESSLKHFVADLRSKLKLL